MILSQRKRIAIAEIVKALPSMPPGFTLEQLAEVVAPRIGLTRGGWRLKGSALVKKTRELLEQPEIIAGIRRVFEIAADFTPVDAARKQVAWINGEVEHNGEKLPPSYQALKDYFDRALPKPAKNVNVNQQSVVTRFEVRSEAPPIRARTIDVEALPVSQETPE